MKKILVVHYSQTGQLSQMVQQFLRPLRHVAHIEIEECAIVPQTPYPFPWSFFRFFNTFPETVHLQPPPIVAPQFSQARYDVVILAYSVWFLSPSQPMTAFLQHTHTRDILRGTPVITLIGCRNMWLMAQEKMKALLTQHGAHLVGNVVKVDAVHSALSFITTPLWLLTGKKQAFGWLPKAGIADHEIADMARFGAKLGDVLQQDMGLDETLFQNMGAVHIDESLMMSEQAARRSFHLWGKWLMAAGRISPLLRRVLVYVYVVFLVAMIMTVVPMSMLLRRVFRRSLREKLAAKRAYFAAPSGE